MTATPRIYDTSAKRKADVMGAVAIASMDDEKTYGRLCYTLGFGKAVEKGILTDYKIVVMNVGEDMLPATMQQHLGSAVEIKRTTKPSSSASGRPCSTAPMRVVSRPSAGTRRSTWATRSACCATRSRSHRASRHQSNSARSSRT